MKLPYLSFCVIAVIATSVRTEFVDANDVAASTYDNVIHSRRLKGVGSSSSESRITKDGLPMINKNRRRSLGNRSDKDDDKKKEPEGLPKKRDCKLTTKKKDDVEFECRADTTDSRLKVKDKIQFKVSSNAKGANVKVEYASDISDDTPEEHEKASSVEKDVDEKKKEEDSNKEKEAVKADDEKVVPDDKADDRKLRKEKMDDNLNSNHTLTSYEITYDSIIEYVKKNNAPNGKMEYDFGETDEIIQEIKLKDWQPMSEPTTDADGIKSYFSSSTNDGMVTFNFTISRAPDKNNVDVTANKMKIDFTIQDFPWQRDDSYVALISYVNSQRHVVLEYDDDAEVIEEGGPAEFKAAGGPEGSTMSNANGQANKDSKSPKKAKRTSKVSIGFNAAIKGMGNWSPMGDYTWKTTAEATERDSTTEQANENLEESVDINTVAVTSRSGTKNHTRHGGGEGEGGQQRLLDIYYLSEGNVSPTEQGQEVAESSESNSVNNSTSSSTDTTGTTTGADGTTRNEGFHNDAEQTEGGTNESKKKNADDSGNRSGNKKNTIKVVATTLETDEDYVGPQTIAFSFVGEKAQHAKKIYWDPEAGIGYSSAWSTTSSSGRNSMVMLITLTSSVLLGLYSIIA